MQSKASAPVALDQLPPAPEEIPLTAENIVEKRTPEAAEKDVFLACLGTLYDVQHPFRLGVQDKGWKDEDCKLGVMLNGTKRKDAADAKKQQAEILKLRQERLKLLREAAAKKKLEEEKKKTEKVRDDIKDGVPKKRKFNNKPDAKK